MTCNTTYGSDNSYIIYNSFVLTIETYVFIITYKIVKSISDIQRINLT